MVRARSDSSIKVAACTHSRDAMNILPTANATSPCTHHSLQQFFYMFVTSPANLQPVCVTDHGVLGANSFRLLRLRWAAVISLRWDCLPSSRSCMTYSASSSGILPVHCVGSFFSSTNSVSLFFNLVYCSWVLRSYDVQKRLALYSIWLLLRAYCIQSLD